MSKPSKKIQNFVYYLQEMYTSLYFNLQQQQQKQKHSIQHQSCPPLNQI